MKAVFGDELLQLFSTSVATLACTFSNSIGLFCSTPGSAVAGFEILLNNPALKF
jgi:hypothetical protein